MAVRAGNEARRGKPSAPEARNNGTFAETLDRVEGDIGNIKILGDIDRRIRAVRMAFETDFIFIRCLLHLDMIPPVPRKALKRLPFFRGMHIVTVKTGSMALPQRIVIRQLLT